MWQRNFSRIRKSKLLDLELRMYAYKKRYISFLIAGLVSIALGIMLKIPLQECLLAFTGLGALSVYVVTRETYEVMGNIAGLIILLIYIYYLQKSNFPAAVVYVFDGIYLSVQFLIMLLVMLSHFY